MDDICLAGITTITSTTPKAEGVVWDQKGDACPFWVCSALPADLHPHSIHSPSLTTPAVLPHFSITLIANCPFYTMSASDADTQVEPTSSTLIQRKISFVLSLYP